MRGLAHFDVMNWKLVPTEPTDAMLKAADDGDMEYTRRNFGDIQKVMQGPHDHWVAMLSAAPEPPQQMTDTLPPLPKSAIRLDDFEDADGADISGDYYTADQMRAYAAAAVAAMREELTVTDKLLADRQRVIDAIPECPDHGTNCVPHALEWVRRAITGTEAAVAAEREACAKPTEAMELAGMRALRNTYRTVSGEYSREQARACWDAMVRARKS